MTFAEKIGLREFLKRNLCWWGLLLVFAVTFFWPDRKEATNVSRILLLSPVLLCLSWPVVRGVLKISAFRWFAALSLFFSISMLWGAEASAIDNHLLRILSGWLLVFMLYCVACYRPESFARLDKVLVGFGLVWLVFLLTDWGSVWQTGPRFVIHEVSRGVFNHHLQVGWMLAVLTLLAIQGVFRSKTLAAKTCMVTTSIVFFALLLLAQARGGLLVFFSGLLVWLFIYLRGGRWFGAAGLLAMLAGVGIAIRLFLPELYQSLIARGSAGRFHIWQNWFEIWQVSPAKVFLGYGLNSSPENSLGHFVAAHYHNFYLNTLFYGGLVGLALMFGWLFSSLRACFKSRQYTSPWFTVVIGMLAGFLTDGDKLFNYPGAMTFCFLLPMFCLVLSAENLRSEQF